MRALFAAVLVAATIGCGTRGIAQSAARPWSRVSLTAGASLASTSLPDQGEGHAGISAFGAAGVRINDLLAVGVHASKWVGFEPDERTFWFATTDYFPTYRSGNHAWRLTAGVGAGRIVGHPFAGGHATSEIEGTAPAWMLGASYDFRIGALSISPYLNTGTTFGSGLSERYCSTPGYLSGDFTQVCSTNSVGAVRVSSLGFSIGVR